MSASSLFSFEPIEVLEVAHAGHLSFADNDVLRAMTADEQAPDDHTVADDVEMDEGEEDDDMDDDEDSADAEGVEQSER